MRDGWLVLYETLSLACTRVPYRGLPSSALRRAMNWTCPESLSKTPSFRRHLLWLPNPRHRFGTVVLWPGLHRQIKAMAVVGITAVQVALRKYKDVDNGVGVVEFWGGEIALFYSNWIMAAVNTTWPRSWAWGSSNGQCQPAKQPSGYVGTDWDEEGDGAAPSRWFRARLRDRGHEFEAACLVDLPMRLNMTGAVQAVKMGCASQARRHTFMWMENAQLPMSLASEASSTLACSASDLSSTEEGTRSSYVNSLGKLHPESGSYLNLSTSMP